MEMLAYAELFQAEAGEYMQVLNRCLLNLEKAPSDGESLSEAFRAAHSLKGMAGTMGYRQVTDLAHGLENFLEDIKKERLYPSAEALDLAFEALDLLQLALHNPQESSSSNQRGIEQMLLKIKGFQENCLKQGSGSGQQEADGGSIELLLGEMERETIRQLRLRGEAPVLVKVGLRRDTVMKSVRSYMVLRALEEIGEIICTAPSRQDLDEENFAQHFQIGLIMKGEADQVHMEKILLNILDVEQVTILPWPASEQLEQTTVNRTQEAVSAEQHQNMAADKMVRVETQKLDELINLVGEMVVARTRIIEVGKGYSEDLDGTIDQLKRAITNLQDTAMKLRMVPIRQVFERFPRMMRDICRDKNKIIQLVISGEHTELDRSIINQLSDPLVHLLRNAADHGIETPDLRAAAGKEPAGTVYLKAHHEGRQIVITVEDDGAGIDPAVVLRKALQKGVISEADAARMSEEEAIQLIFQSGFSTAEQITDVSGRGVGMDVVRKSIAALHGSIEVKSKPKEMTRFVLRLPLTLAIIKSLMVRSGSQIYAIPLEAVRCNVYLQQAEIKTVCGRPVVNLRGEVIPLYRLSELLRLNRDGDLAGELAVVVTEVGGEVSGLIVDELIGQQEIVIKSIYDFFQQLKGIAGATILGDGRVSLILDVAGLMGKGRVFN